MDIATGWPTVPVRADSRLHALLDALLMHAAVKATVTSRPSGTVAVFRLAGDHANTVIAVDTSIEDLVSEVLDETEMFLLRLGSEPRTYMLVVEPSGASGVYWYGLRIDLSERKLRLWPTRTPSRGV